MTTSLKNISVIGAGAWGTALAQVFANADRNITLYAREPELVANINQNHENNLFLPGVKLSPNIRTTGSLGEAVKDAGIVLLVTPVQFTRNVMLEIKPHLASGAPIVNCAKGIEITTGKLLSEVAAEVLPDAPYAVLSGPTFAHEVARGLPTAVTFATTAPAKQAQAWAEALHGKSFRPYLSHDATGVEIGAALKNVIAIACGIVGGRKLGENARAAVMTRGIAEIKRLGLKKGAVAETFLGLSGLGDLALTCNSISSRNYSLGFALGQGRSLEEVLGARRSVAEGVTTARALAAHAHKLQVEMPISLAVDNILHGNVNIDSVITGLLSRNIKEENG